ncbi:L,D-transpeptidase family protein [Verrucomicrobiaceae bacterium N1E253]|uniref:L,D-transpeptidase family protein n=2 Tax=Oceaniferula marina TaxID=2748318 RepID=A0A851GE71_9BACT|nr:L,D-transpeptidase family protein [Oceaniferula marina]
MRPLALLLLSCLPLLAQIPKNCSQVVVGIAENWNSTNATLTLYQKHGRSWKNQGQSWQTRLGKKGLAWGRGLHRTPESKAPAKREGDWKAPAGVFKIGGAYGYAAKVQHHPKLPYRQITTSDLWVEDRNSPHYNRHIILNHPASTAWEKKAQMRQNDHAHSLKLYIAHNDAMLGGKAIPGLGSAIFFHIWRSNGTRPTAGCTTMQENKLKQLIANIDPAKNPVYVLLPKAEYQQLKKQWKLP